MITQLTFKVAYEIASDRFELRDFFQKGKFNEFILFPHTHFFYTYVNGNPSFHKVVTGCHCCRQIVARNKGGYGCLYLMKSQIARRDFVLFCKSCVKWRNTIIYQPNQTGQLTLF